MLTRVLSALTFCSGFKELRRRRTGVKYAETEQQGLGLGVEAVWRRSMMSRPPAIIRETGNECGLITMTG